MPADASIYGLVHPLKPAAGPMDQHAQMLQLKNLMMQQEELERGVSERSQLRDLFSRGAPTAEQVMSVSPEKGLAYQKNLREQKSADIADKAKEMETVVKAFGILKDRLPTVRDEASYRAYADTAVSLLGPDVAKNLELPPAYDPQWVARQVVEAKELFTPKPEKLDLGGRVQVIDINPFTNPAVIGLQLNKTATPGEQMTDARQRELNAITREGQQTQIVNDPTQGPILINKGTGQARPATFADGSKVPGETTAKAVQNSADVQMLLAEAEKNIKKATGSYVGAAYDQLARVFGRAPEGAIAIGNLKAVEGALLSKMPRMEGPQSNFDVQAYREAAGNIGDPTIPNKQKIAAVETVKRIQEKYATNRAGATKPAPPTSDPSKGGPRGIKFLGFE